MLDLVAVLGSYSLLTTAGYLTAHPELWNHINLQPTTATPLQKGPELSCPTASSGSLAPMLCPNASLCVHLQVGKQVGWEAWLGLRETLISEDQPEKFLPRPGKIRESVLVPSPACCGVRSSSREHPAPAGWTPGLWVWHARGWSTGVEIFQPSRKTCAAQIQVGIHESCCFPNSCFAFLACLLPTAAEQALKPFCLSHYFYSSSA